MLTHLRNRLRQLLIVLAIGGTVGFALYADLLPLGGRFQPQLWTTYDLLLTPMGVTFAAWGVVAGGMIAYATYQMMPRQTQNGLHNRLFPWLLLACGGHVGWVFCLHVELLEWALFAIFLQMDGLLAIYMLLGFGRIRVRRNEILFVRIPFSLYLGWTSLMATLTFTAYLTTTAWDQLAIDSASWLLLVLMLITILVGIVAVRHRDFVLGLIVVWWLAGVGLQHPSDLVVVMAVIILSLALMLSIAAVPSGR